MPDLHSWTAQQIDKTEHQARLAAELQAPQWTCPSTGVVDLGVDLISTGDRDVAYHIALHDPDNVLRRCAADRKILNRHRLDPDAHWSDRTMCEGCGTTGDCDWPVTGNLNDCLELLDLAEGYGLTPEILATLDRPQRGERPDPGPGFQMPEPIAEAYGQMWVHVIGTRPVEPRPTRTPRIQPEDRP